MSSNEYTPATDAIILARVSSKEQEEGYSIDAQRHRLQEYCQKRGLNVLKIFEITESSTAGDRTKFKEMLSYCRKRKRTIAIVADKVDRVQRSFTETPILDKLIKAGEIELHFNTENMVFTQTSSAQEGIVWRMHVLMAESYVNSLSENVRRSLEEKRRKGEFTSRAPIGYMNTRDENGKAWIVLDPVRAPLVRRLFLDYATGLYTLGEMVERAADWGLTGRDRNHGPLSKGHIHTILNNPFYYGQMRMKGTLYDHHYDTITTKTIFDKCQDVMHGWKKKPFKSYGSVPFALRGLVTCGTTERVVTCERQEKTYKNGKKAAWTYLRNWKPEDPKKFMWTREEVVMEQIEAVLDSIRVPPDLMKSIITYIRKTDRTEREFLERQVSELQKDHNKLQARLNKLMDAFLDGVIEKEDYEYKREDIRAQQIKLQEMIKAHTKADDKFKRSMITLLELSSRAKVIFQGSTVAQKREIIGFVFQNLTLTGRKLTYTLRSPFAEFAKCEKIDQWCAQVDAFRTNAKLRHLITTSIEPVFMRSQETLAA